VEIHRYNIVSEWKNSRSGKTVIVEREGKKFLLIKYSLPVEPIMNGALDSKTFAKSKKCFDDFVDLRKSINSKLRENSSICNELVVPIEEGVADHHYMEVYEVIDAIDCDKSKLLLDSLRPNEKKLLMLSLASALNKLHSNGIVHGDVSPSNIIFTRNPAGIYLAKIINFDSSYFINFLPNEVIGDVGYYSPELGQYADAEDEREELGKTLTSQSDIFSLGLIFHIYLSGEMPQAKSLTERLQKRKDKGKPIYCWTILNSGCELVLSDKITSLKYMSLIQDMLNIDPTKRPTATQVLQRLKALEG